MCAFLWNLTVQMDFHALLLLHVVLSFVMFYETM